MTTIYVTHPRYVEHDLPGHPEHAGRIRAVWDELDSSGLADRMLQKEATPVTDEQILSVHIAQHVENLRKVEQGQHNAQFDSDTYLLPVSPEIARLSAGGVVLATEMVVNGQADNGLAITRPPGHHAIPERGMGFCLLGNIAIAAKHAQKLPGIKRVLIVDYDVHHGNGTQDIFYEDPSVMFISTHQSPFYPGTGTLRETGRRDGRGFTINIPLRAGQGDQNYQRVFDEIIRPAAERFRPQLILVSAGFDAHWIDPLAGMMLSLTGYANLTKSLNDMSRDLCNGKIVFVMEGGYDLVALSHGIANVARVLLGDEEFPDLLGAAGRREPDIEELVNALKILHKL